MMTKSQVVHWLWSIGALERVPAPANSNTRGLPDMFNLISSAQLMATKEEGAKIRDVPTGFAKAIAKAVADLPSPWSSQRRKQLMLGDFSHETAKSRAIGKVRKV